MSISDGGMPLCGTVKTDFSCRCQSFKTITRPKFLSTTELGFSHDFSHVTTCTREHIWHCCTDHQENSN